MGSSSESTPFRNIRNDFPKSAIDEGVMTMTSDQSDEQSGLPQLDRNFIVAKLPRNLS